MNLFPHSRSRGEHGMELSGYAVGAGLIVIAVAVAFSDIGSRMPKSEEQQMQAVAQRTGKNGCHPTKVEWVSAITPYERVALVTCGELGNLRYGIPKGKGWADAALLK